ncbi:pirin family protein [Rhodococcus zopfii]|uniref:pirin family protein n=1 Tax=Rhodococcus zopfii TaxID=43772 RepID=UPI0035274568
MTTQPSHGSPDTGRVFRLGRPWRALDPFLFAMHHVDHYPAGTANLGPASVADHDLGSDFDNPAGWNMYHGRTVPGFPAYPHRGFETITIVERGYVDHADSAGATARYGQGDVQWLTAGNGVSHSEMFPLLEESAYNPFELFQIWLNLPAAGKAAAPEFTMQWNEDIPVVTVRSPAGAATVKVIAGRYGAAEPVSPPTNSWAANPESDVAVWLIELEPHARVELPASAAAGARRILYVYGDDSHAIVEGLGVAAGNGFAQYIHGTTTVSTGDRSAKLLLLQGVPIGEPVAQHGPFVMNTSAELQQAYDDYRRTEFGGWPWDRVDVVHDRGTGRFARHSDGSVSTPRLTEPRGDRQPPRRERRSEDRAVDDVVPGRIVETGDANQHRRQARYCRRFRWTGQRTRPPVRRRPPPPRSPQQRSHCGP